VDQQQVSSSVKVECEEKAEPAWTKSFLRREERERLSPFLMERGKAFFYFLLYKK